MADDTYALVAQLNSIETKKGARGDFYNLTFTDRDDKVHTLRAFAQDTFITSLIVGSWYNMTVKADSNYLHKVKTALQLEAPSTPAAPSSDYPTDYDIRCEVLRAACKVATGDSNFWQFVKECEYYLTDGTIPPKPDPRLIHQAKEIVQTSQQTHTGGQGEA